jgi:hypothetical protein
MDYQRTGTDHNFSEGIESITSSHANYPSLSRRTQEPEDAFDRLPQHL